jgi:23S rRNA pseudouridine955/2504/2580 synthase/23S rRNA pseudouridine1911/1915/1917 synthase
VASSGDHLPILFHAGAIIAVDKPAGLAVIPGRGESDTVLERLAAQLDLPWTGAVDPRIRVVHRLDKHTSGVLIYATDVAAQRHLSRQFQNNTISKEYLALVVGRPTEEQGTIASPIGPHPTVKQRMIVTPHGRLAITHWKIEQRLGDWTLLRVFPKTGKTHQIRVHLKSIGLPLAIDPLYNPPSNSQPNSSRGSGGGVSQIFLSQFKRDYRPTRGEPERPLIARLTLHAQRLRFLDQAEQPQQIESPVPKDLRATINQLSRHVRR